MGKDMGFMDRAKHQVLCTDNASRSFKDSCASMRYIETNRMATLGMKKPVPGYGPDPAMKSKRPQPGRINLSVIGKEVNERRFCYEEGNTPASVLIGATQSVI